MTQVASRLSIANPTDKVVHDVDQWRIVGTVHRLTRAQFDTAVAAQRAAMAAAADAASAAVAGMWLADERVHIVGEVGVRLWGIGSGANAAAVSAGSHARRVELYPGLTITLAGDANGVLGVDGVPIAGIGSNGDVSADWSANVYYTKSGGSWALTGSLYPAQASGPLSVSITYDGSGRVATATTDVRSYAYTHAAGSMVISASDGAVATITLDGSNRVTGFTRNF